VHLFGSGPILRNALAAQEILRDKFGISADVWSVTSYNELFRDCLRCERWNRLHPDQPTQTSWFEKQLKGQDWPIVAASDYVKSLPARLERWSPKGLCALGTDGFGRSESREALRQFFEISAEHIAYSGLCELARIGQLDKSKLAAALKTLGINADAPEPALS
jgi:pyruvate dehydrogenase E1 component